MDQRNEAETLNPIIRASLHELTIAASRSIPRGKWVSVDLARIEWNRTVLHPLAQEVRNHMTSAHAE